MVNLVVAVIAPSILNTNGDAENAQVLARRAEWAGAKSDIATIESPADLPDRVDAVVIGSGSDADLDQARELILGIQDELRAWSAARIPILAVGTGWELLSGGIELADGSVVDGLGLVAGRAVPGPTHVSDDMVVISPRFGRLVGFENHAREYIGAEGSPLGRLIYGTGNGRGSSQEGLMMGDVIGTHLHGPVLAKNPRMADRLLETMFARAGTKYAAGNEVATLDHYAAGARALVLERLALPAD